MTEMTDRDKIWVDLIQLLCDSHSTITLSSMSEAREEVDEDEIEEVLNIAVESRILEKEESPYTQYRPDFGLYKVLSDDEVREAIDTLLRY